MFRSLFGHGKPAWKPPFIGADYLGVFVLVAALYAFINWSPTFLDPDSFYHVKVTQLMAQSGIVRDFVWLPFTTLSHDYADHHFLYHVLLAPFLSAFGPFVGAKVATVALAAAALTAFYGALRAYGTRLPFVFTMLLATTGAFILRVNLTKTSAISVMVLMLALIAMRKDRPMLLFALSWTYVWLYGGWPIMALVVGAFLIARAVADRLMDKHPLHSWGHVWFWKRLLGFRRNALADFFAKSETRLAAAAASGLLCGLVINPYFPANVGFYWEQIVQIAVINYSETIGVGAEWYPYSVIGFFNGTSGLMLAIATCLAISLAMLLWPQLSRRGDGHSRQALTGMAAATVLAVLFMVLAFRSRRHIEYFAPFATFALAQGFTAMVHNLRFDRLTERLNDLVPKKLSSPYLRAEAVIGLYLLVVVLFTSGRDVYGYAELFREGIPWNQYDRSAEWMRANIPAGAVIVHSDWDQFPPLFMKDDTHRYIIGLDPTFLYRENPERYWTWVNLSTGKYSGDAAAAAAKHFDARYFFVANRYTAMRAMLERNPDVTLLYHDEEADIYGTR